MSSVLAQYLQVSTNAIRQNNSTLLAAVINFSSTEQLLIQLKEELRQVWLISKYQAHT